jgi:hypothetical protein
MQAIPYDRRDYHDVAWRIIPAFNRYRDIWRLDCRPRDRRQYLLARPSSAN